MNPPGWTTNPSAWTQRLPIVAVALLGFAIASYLTLFQLAVIRQVWEPFFGGGSERILTSRVSRVLPIPDAALGAIGYLVDAVTGMIGGPRRWRDLPWVVIVFGLAVGPLGALSVLLVVLQPLLYDTWCTLCLASAVISLLMIGPAVDEVLASLQQMRGRRTAGGGMRMRGTLWAQAASLVIALGVTAAPAVGAYGVPAATHHQLLGPIAASVAFVAMWEVTSALRWANLIVGGALIASPSFGRYDPIAVGVALLSGAALIALQFPASPTSERYGGGWRSLL